MSAQAAILTGLAVVLVVGFAWYERSRPPSRLVALVAALAALAVAGRLALAPLPNVMATTDIALLTGYALGPAPGFAVGALAAPISNIWLGQGPWTAWQMAGWGMAGLIGAALAAVGGRNAGRLVLASFCALAGLAYGALLDFSVMVTYGGEQSLERFLALSARGLPFNVAHAAGNFAIAFAIGPALVRMLSRYRVRLEFTWRPATAVSAVLAVVCAAALASPPAAEAAGIDRARVWLERSQNPDGGYSFSPGSPSNPKMTGWAMLGLEAAGRNPLDVRRGGRTPVAYLRANAARLRRDPGTLQLAILALEGAGLNSRRFAGRDLVGDLRARQSANGSFGGQVNLTAYGILALRSAGASAGIADAAAWLRSAQNGDGGWGFAPGRRSDPDSTGSALQGLARAGGGGIRGGVAYLRRTQRSGGGWGLAEAGVTNSQSTAFAVMGLVAARVNPSSVRTGGRSGPEFLARRQARDGRYRYSARSDQTPVWVTSQALIAVGRQALPIRPVSRSRSRSVSPRPEIGTLADVHAESPDPRARGPVAEEGGARGRAGKPRARGARGPSAGRDDGRRTDDRVRLRAGAAALASDADGEGERDGDPAALYALGGLGALAAALAGGFVWYRRRLS